MEFSDRNIFNLTPFGFTLIRAIVLKFVLFVTVPTNLKRCVETSLFLLDPMCIIRKDMILSFLMENKLLIKYDR